MTEASTNCLRTLVVVPTLNEARTIEPLLTGLLAQDAPGGMEPCFVVCDGGSTDGTADIVRQMASQHACLRLLHNPKRLQSAAINLAVQTFGQDSDVLVRCDAHAEYPPHFVASLVSSLAQHQADAVVVPMDSVGLTCQGRATAWVSDTIVGSGGSAHRGGMRSGWVEHGHHAAFRMSSFLRAGGYDESFSHNEDAELDCRQRALGGRIFLDANIRLRYFPRSSLKALAKQYFNYGRGRARTLQRHPGSLAARQFAVPLHMLLCAAAVLLAPWFPLLLIWPGLYLLTLAAVSLKLAASKRSVCGLLAGPAAATMHAAWAVGLLYGFARCRETRWRPAGTDVAGVGSKFS